MNIHLIGLLAIVLAVFLILNRLIGLLPDKDGYYKARYGFAGSRKRYRVWFLFERLIVGALILLSGLFWYFIYQAMAVPKWYGSITNAECILIPDNYYAGIVALTLGLATSFIPVILLEKAVMKDDFYRIIGNSLAFPHRESRKISRILSNSCFAVGTVLLILGANCYTYFNQDSIVVNPYLSFKEKVYRYEDVSHMYIVNYRPTRYGIEYSPYYVIEFSDQNEINTMNYQSVNDEFEKRMFRVVLLRSGKQIERRD